MKTYDDWCWHDESDDNIESGSSYSGAREICAVISSALNSLKKPLIINKIKPEKTGKLIIEAE